MKRGLGGRKKDSGGERVRGGRRGRSNEKRVGREGMKRG